MTTTATRRCGVLSILWVMAVGKILAFRPLALSKTTRTTSIQAERRLAAPSSSLESCCQSTPFQRHVNQRFSSFLVILQAAGDDTDKENDDEPEEPKQPKQNKKPAKNSNDAPTTPTPTTPSKEDLVRMVGERMRSSKLDDSNSNSNSDPESSSGGGLLDKINPFKAGQNLRKQIDTAITSISAQAQADRKSIYLIDDRITGGVGASSSSGSTTNAGTLLDRLVDQDDFVPEVLVVGATGEVGRLVVRRLLLDGRFRVRVLVRDLYTKTLNMLGTGVTYCQGDLSNMDSLEYALTDVDKIVFCASAPRSDESQFQDKFKDFIKENLDATSSSTSSTTTTAATTTTTPKSFIPMTSSAAAASNGIMAKVEEQKSSSDMEWEQLDAVLEVRARLAEQVDCIGMQNLVRAYQHVRHADYGTSQAAKRSLFKFQSRPEDFNLFALDDKGDDDAMDDINAAYDEMMSGGGGPLEASGGGSATSKYSSYYDEDDEIEDEYDDYGNYKIEEVEGAGSSSSSSSIEKRRGASVNARVQWMRNKFNHAVFVGKLPKFQGGGGAVITKSGEAAIVSSRLRSREDPDNGIDLGSGFAGFICRVCSDGGVYEAFIRTGAYDSHGVEYVCEFSTSTKKPNTAGKNKSTNKFTTIRLPFESFKPERRVSTLTKGKAGDNNDASIPPFKGRDVRNIGFRYRTASNELKSKLTPGELDRFYLAFSYIKLYRSQPEPEFVYVSDARIPRVVRDGMVRHDLRQLVATTAAADDDESVSLFDGSAMQTITKNKKSRSPEEVYYKYRGEEILKKSGLSYSIVRVAEYNESPSGEASSIDLIPDNNNNKDEVAAVSRDEVAQVCVSALLDPNALNKSFYISKKKGKTSTSFDEDVSAKFSSLPLDVVV